MPQSYDAETLLNQILIGVAPPGISISQETADRTRQIAGACFPAIADEALTRLTNAPAPATE